MPSCSSNLCNLGKQRNRGMVSKVVTFACAAAVAAVALLGHDDNNGGDNEKIGIVPKVFIAVAAAMAAKALFTHLFALFSAPNLVSEPEVAENDDINTTSEKFMGWKFPRHGWIKCNVDGSAPVDKLSGCGGVFRDSTGSWKHGFSRSFDRCESSAAEYEAICTGLDTALKKGFRKLILETDSRTAVEVVNNVNGSRAHKSQEKKLVGNIRDLVDNGKWHVKPEIVHVNGEGNKVANWLANLSHGLQVGDHIELSELPYGCHSVEKLVLADVKHAKTMAGSSDSLRRCIVIIKGATYVLVAFLFLLFLGLVAFLFLFFLGFVLQLVFN